MRRETSLALLAGFLWAGGVPVFGGGAEECGVTTIPRRIIIYCGPVQPCPRRPVIPRDDRFYLKGRLCQERVTVCYSEGSLVRSVPARRSRRVRSKPVAARKTVIRSKTVTVKRKPVTVKSQAVSVVLNQLRQELADEKKNVDQLQMAVRQVVVERQQAARPTFFRLVIREKILVVLAILLAVLAVIALVRAIIHR